MVYIVDKHNCCGCTACVQVCPKMCISFPEDEEGFRYPYVDKETCIDCGLCENVCPVLNQTEPKKPLNVYAAINPNEEIRMKSSSGGIFTILAEKVINEGGVVFGARFDENWEVMHDFTKTIEGLEVFRGSKYLQSRIGETYKQAREFLRAGFKVLYTGTSCQILGLKMFLRKEYDNLLTVDIVCHGVPSPKIWKSYLQDINSMNQKITYINLRAKIRGWKRYSYLIKAGDNVLYDDYAANSMYLKGFMSNVFLRPSCYKCPAKEGRSNSDITLADNWGYWDIKPENFDDMGVSAVMVNTNKGNEFLNKLSIKLQQYSIEAFIASNLSYKKSMESPKYRSFFWQEFPKLGFNVITIINKKMQPSIIRRIISKFSDF
ncbi:Coenzyme F420 hydrogenase/dehydrogenase, beta subunit C-terminal domain [uncultured Bacteroides sp.]|uniref:Coenzyme F420 hydrogenase/dehydrogenase, beta subunit C-terminal domain n=1 Tax=uncultured Bacteroides sp. TaxID=162156 RepID=UPI002AA71C47|nr:Coenzyme F420 hydrogenase/dehydrogenase, beta subunit C-terminal domain [uncultured Bacteroides sp.]